jgi:hypothetical protein
MADTKISALTASTIPLAGTEVLPIVQSGTTVKVAVANLTDGRAVSAASYRPTGATIPSTNGIYAAAANATGFGNVGVETFRTTANNTIQVGSTTGATAKIFVYANNSVAGADVNAAVYIRQDGTNHIQTWAGPGGNVRGYWEAAGDLVVDDGNIRFVTSGKGIDFSATPGTGTSELLNDYEEGDWTPTLTASIGSITTVGTCTGQYTKIGRQVTLSMDLRITTNGVAAGFITVGGIPINIGTTLYGAGCGSEIGVTGKLIQISPATQTTINITNYDGTYPGATGFRANLVFTYFV